MRRYTKMKENKTFKTIEEPKIEICRFSNSDVLTTSTMPLMLTHGYNTELQNCGLGGYFDTEDWYVNGHQS